MRKRGLDVFCASMSKHSIHSIVGTKILSFRRRCVLLGQGLDIIKSILPHFCDNFLNKKLYFRDKNV